jgi:hypothetical protein
MTDYTQSVTVGAAGTASIDFSPTSPGLNWVVAQFSLETQPFRVGCTCIVRKNGRFLSSTILGSGDTAYGPPAIILYRGDILNFFWNGLQNGDECIATLFYNESTWSQSPDPTIAV